MASVSITTSQMVVATATFSDGSVPSDTAWSIGDTAVATIVFTGNSCTVSAVAAGATTLTVTGGGAHDTAVVTVASDLTVSISFGDPTPKA